MRGMKSSFVSRYWKFHEKLSFLKSPWRISQIFFSCEIKLKLWNEILNFSFFYFQIKTKTMTETSLSRGSSPPNTMNQDYDITRMREDDFERLAVYIVPDVPCERGIQGRAEKTLPRSLALKASLVLSTPTQPVSFDFLTNFENSNFLFLKVSSFKAF